MNRLSLIGLSSMLVATAAVAQQPNSAPMMKSMPHTQTMQPAASDSQATKGFKQAMMTMMTSTPPYTGDADVDFMKQMKVHHQAAVDMAKVQLAAGKDAEARKLAQAIVTSQEQEIATIDRWLKAKGM